MLDSVGERVADLITSVLMGEHDVPPDQVPGWRAITSNRATARRGGSLIVEALQSEGLIARCSCPHGFGQVRNGNCAAHGSRVPAHTITGVAAGSEP